MRFKTWKDGEHIEFLYPDSKTGALKSRRGVVQGEETIQHPKTVKNHGPSILLLMDDTTCYRRFLVGKMKKCRQLT